MVWQDVVYAVGQWVFIVALIPSILSKDKPALTSSLLTGLVLLVYAFTLASLNLWISTISTLATSVAWFVLALQKYKLDNRVRGKKIV